MGRYIAAESASTLIRLAPDLTHPDDISANTSTVILTGINCTGGLTNVLSLTGKYAIMLMILSSMTLETVTIKLTIDGIVIHNATFSIGGSAHWVLGNNGVPNEISAIQCNSSLLLQVQMATDTSINLVYSVKPIL